MEFKLTPSSLLRLLPLALIVLVLSFIVGDEVSNRLKRREYRDRCVEMYSMNLNSEVLPLVEMKCYQLIP